MAVADDEVRPQSTAAAAEEEEEAAPGDAKNKKRRSSVLGALREAIGKVRFLLSFSATRWVLLASSAARGGPARRLSFDARPAGLLEVEGSIVAPSPASSSSSSSSGSRTSRSTSLGTASARSLSRTSSAASPAAAAQMKRASSSASGAGSPGSPSAGYDDIDQRAEMFIANFYRQLRMERQVSLQLRYVRGNSWDRTP